MGYTGGILGLYWGFVGGYIWGLCTLRPFSGMG